MTALPGKIAKFLPSRLHAKVSLGVILPLLLILGVFTAVGYRRQREATLAELSKLAAYTGRVVESDLRHQMMRSDFAGLQGLLDTIGEQEEISTLYLLDSSSRVIFAPGEEAVGLRLDNGRADCQVCHALPVNARPDSVVTVTPAGERVFRSMAPIENSPECAQCHQDEGPLIGMLLIDVSVAPFGERLTSYLQQNLLLWFSVIIITILVVYLVVNHFVLRRLADVVLAIGRMSRGTQPPPVPEGSPDEIGQLVRAFNRMADQIETRNRQNDRLSGALQQQSQQRGRLLQRLISAQEDERIRVARELHDELGQSLTGLALRAQALERYLPDGEEQAQGLAILQQIRELIGGTTEQMYDIIMALRPSILDDLGLVAALHAYAERTLEGTGLAFEMDDRCFEHRLPAAVETTLFRTFQEGISNVVRHAAAHRVWLTLRCEGGFFEGELVDDGRGFDLDAVQPNGHHPRGLGLLGMHERITQCGGEMEIVTAPGRGTRIRFYIPLEREVKIAREN